MNNWKARKEVKGNCDLRENAKFSEKKDFYGEMWVKRNLEKLPEDCLIVLAALQAITTAPVLRSPDQSKSFIVTTDASRFAVGAELNQKHEGKLYPVAFMSKKLSPAERNYPTHEQELLAILSAIPEWKCYLDGQKFQVLTDHKSLIYLKKQPHLSPRQTRWLEFLSQFDLDCKA